MMQLLENVRRRFAIKKYARKMPPLLRKRYGKSVTYTHGQIRSTAEVARLPAAYLYYGYVMFMTKEAFDQLPAEIGVDCDYAAMKQTVADICFDGDSSFTGLDVIEHAGPSAASFGGDSDVGVDATSHAASGHD